MGSTCAGMVESIKVTRRCWLGFDGSVMAQLWPTGVVQVEISWVMPDGIPMHDSKMFNGLDLLGLPDTAVPMLTHVYCLPHEGHPGACTLGMAYLLRVRDTANNPDVVARFRLFPNRHGRDPDAVFEIGPLNESGPDIYPLDIEDL